MSTVHFLPNRAIQERDSVQFIIMGAGGTGSHFAKELGRINFALKSLNRRPIDVSIIDFDVISDTTPYRTTFSNKLIGLTKADTLAQDINNFYDCQFNGYSTSDPIKKMDELFRQIRYQTVFVVTCVDTISARQKIYKQLLQKTYKIFNKELREESGFYWLDFGNEVDYGQFVLGTMFSTRQPKNIDFDTVPDLKKVIDIFPNFFKQKDTNHDSCSIMDMLQNQNLHINQILATFGAEMIWNLLFYRYIDYHGMAINLRTRQFNTFQI